MIAQMSALVEHAAIVASKRVTLIAASTMPVTIKFSALITERVFATNWIGTDKICAIGNSANSELFNCFFIPLSITGITRFRRIPLFAFFFVAHFNFNFFYLPRPSTARKTLHTMKNEHVQDKIVIAIREVCTISFESSINKDAKSAIKPMQPIHKNNPTTQFVSSLP
jgi:hypothetical protein